MDGNQLFWFWLIGSAILMASELVVPGLITIFLGIAALIIAGAYKLGFISKILPGFTSWFIVSLFLIFVVREFVKKMLPGETHYKTVNEDTDACGTIVDVIEDVCLAHTNGRIRYRGTTWQATTPAECISAGDQARIIARENLVWIVEPVDKNLLETIDS